MKRPAVARISNAMAVTIPLTESISRSTSAATPTLRRTRRAEVVFEHQPRQGEFLEFRIRGDARPLLCGFDQARRDATGQAGETDVPT